MVHQASERSAIALNHGYEPYGRPASPDGHVQPPGAAPDRRGATVRCMCNHVSRVMQMTKWRIIKNKWNLKKAPWGEWCDAVGIEEDDDSTAVPAVVCWFTRGWPDLLAMAQSVVDEHNRNVVRSEESFMPSWFQWFNIFGKLLPFIESAMQTIAKDTGKPLESTVEDIINHLTPGQPNSSSLNG